MPIQNNLAAHARRSTRVYSEADEWVPCGVVGQDLLATETTGAAQALLAGATGASLGAVAGTGVAVAESYGTLIRTVFTLTAVSVTMTDQGAAGSQGNLKIYDWPEGLVFVVGAVVNLTIARVGTAIATTAAVVGSLGSVAAATDNATLTSTEANVVPSTACSLTAGAGAFSGVSTAVAVLDGTATASDLILNFAIPDAGSSGNDALTVAGTITMTWLLLGDK